LAAHVLGAEMDVGHIAFKLSVTFAWVNIFNPMKFICENEDTILWRIYAMQEL
jgi:hypothetical protein